MTNNSDFHNNIESSGMKNIYIGKIKNENNHNNNNYSIINKTINNSGLNATSYESGTRTNTKKAVSTLSDKIVRLDTMLLKLCGKGHIQFSVFLFLRITVDRKK